ncbi:hypothetical protein IMCC14465_15270 [alpha proteobacterium IMCC14465]|uniref:Hydroxyacylglutathione hydrolase n=1 Tax=alpha proteobacterium IMCC14465 TaxID=1220535 RepID=J9A2U8_9PROT|nr:hypothetical protein IMCC14465_15270 [alpha proteobacterium IMCC14465]
MQEIDIIQIPCLNDNYGYLVHHAASGETASIDTPDAAPLLQALADRNWNLTAIYNTHHHYDHVGGNLELKEKTGCKIYGPAGDADKIPGLDEALDDSDMITLGDAQIRILNVGGHTKGHIAYYFCENGCAFVGDTLFMLGCGRLFEGTAQQMWASLKKITNLPPETLIYCAHEYTEANARFAVTIDPDNQNLADRVAEIETLRAADKPTVPASIATELATNPFLRAGDASIQKHLGMTGANLVDVFAQIRTLKDNY